MAAHINCHESQPQPHTYPPSLPPPSEHGPISGYDYYHHAMMNIGRLYSHPQGVSGYEFTPELSTDMPLNKHRRSGTAARQKLDYGDPRPKGGGYLYGRGGHEDEDVTPKSYRPSPTQTGMAFPSKVLPDPDLLITPEKLPGLPGATGLVPDHTTRGQHRVRFDDVIQMKSPPDSFHSQSTDSATTQDSPGTETPGVQNAKDCIDVEGVSVTGHSKNKPDVINTTKNDTGSHYNNGNVKNGLHSQIKVTRHSKDKSSIESQIDALKDLLIETREKEMGCGSKVYRYRTKEDDLSQATQPATKINGYQISENTSKGDAFPSTQGKSKSETTVKPGNKKDNKNFVGKISLGVKTKGSTAIEENTDSRKAIRQNVKRAQSAPPSQSHRTAPGVTSAIRSQTLQKRGYHYPASKVEGQLQQKSGSEENIYARPEFHSTLKVASELKTVKASTIDVAAAVENRLQTSQRVKTKVTEKAVGQVNKQKDSVQFTKLMGLDVPVDELAAVVEVERSAKVKPVVKPKARAKFREPDIMDFFTPDLQRESVSFSTRSVPLSKPKLRTADPGHAFDLFLHISSWED
ncbi:uncharacterized protein LOC106169559 [Lingula anatina]|uniref:Uncharacterized protein LOC106169559 n=1 Tax=Lingula anatina TaxID=7574 RepID=A0A1S3J242_LINAN|nr:uncharacterized protein LOC106169559 [Lingula anatina]|eukprot:XP_013404502.1 uncharacterized protein LOC106169559 [Lingula anatina]